MNKVTAPVLHVLEKSKKARVLYTARQQPRFNLVLAVDSYKLSHAFAYPKNIVGMASYIEARTGGRDIMIPFGRQAVLQRYLSVPITQGDINDAADFASTHGEPFARRVWEHILREYNGFMPLTIRGVPEGTPVRSGHAITTIMCTDAYVAENIFWLCSYFETLLLRGEWYPTTIATDDYKIKRLIKSYYVKTGADMAMLNFALHDFGARGVTCHEQAQIGGAAHLVSFKGSDTIEGIQYANYWYGADMAAFSVPATEHSVQCAFGAGQFAAGSADADTEYMRHVLKNLAHKGGIVSMVIDGFDVYRATDILCGRLVAEIKATGAKIVFRPDSGDMYKIIPYILAKQEAAFGVTVNAHGFKKINTVGLLQGDGIDHEAVEKLLDLVTGLGYSADNIVFGSGGALLQKRNRDTYKFAQKASAVLVAVPASQTEVTYEWVGIAKDPITDPGKKSKEGVLTLARSLITGEHMTVRIDTGSLSTEFEDVMVDVYDHGKFFNLTTLDEVRARCAQ